MCQTSEIVIYLLRRGDNRVVCILAWGLDIIVIRTADVLLYFLVLWRPLFGRHIRTAKVVLKDVVPKYIQHFIILFLKVKVSSGFNEWKYY